MEKRTSLRPKKSLGQHFLRDEYYLTRIVDAARIDSCDHVLEIGPGLGHLTRKLLSRAKTVLVIELDERLVQHLKTEFAGSTNLSIEHSDALAYRYGLLDGSWKVVANLPYYISTPIIQRLIEHRATFSTLTLLLQKEVAERVASPPGTKEYGFLSVLVQLYTEPRLEFSVPANAFTPEPDVDSEVVTLSVRPQPAVTIQNEPFFFRLVKAAFSQRRKTLRNSIKQLGIAKEHMRSAQAETGVDLSRRAETLSVEEFGILANFLVTH